MSFSLDPRLAADTHAVGDLPLCAVRLQDDARWPWLVLVPRHADLRELEDLPPDLRAALMEEAVQVGRAVRAVGAARAFEVAKLNVGALGNVVAQLHVHIVGRRTDDPGGAGPVWSVGTAERYGAEALQRALQAARTALSL